MVSLGVVGAGAWGKNHVRVALEMQDAGLIDRVLVCDVDPARLKPWEEKAETTTSVQAVHRAGLEAVDLATPAETHYDLAREFLEAGRHVLVEKPMAMHGGEAKALADLAARKGLVIMPGHIFRYHPGVIEVKARIERGELGEVRYLGTVRSAFATPRRDVGVLWSLGIHEADLYPYLLGVESATEARAETGAFADPKIDEVASLFFRFSTGAVGFAFESWITPGDRKERRLSVVGMESTVEVDYLRPDRITVHESRMHQETDGWRFEEGRTGEVLVPADEPLRAELEDFVRAVNSGGKIKPRADAASGYRAVEIIEALKRSGAYVAPAGP